MTRGLLVVAVLALVAIAAPAASANPVFDRAIGAKSVDLCSTTCTGGISGSAAGQLSSPTGNPALYGPNQSVYVPDSGNRRVNVYTFTGVFRFAFGKGVELGGANADVCTTACEAGSSGGAAGELASPAGLAISPGGEVFVSDPGNARVSVFTTDGVFLRAFGKGVELGGANGGVCTTACEAGAPGGGAGELTDPRGMSIFAFVYVADRSNRRVSVFTTEGAFVRAFGKGVDAGAANADLCTTACEPGSGGSAAGALSLPSAVTITFDGTAYVADPGNNRVSAIQAFSGAFLRAFGKGVELGGANADVCTMACEAGSGGSAAGELAGGSGTMSLSVFGDDVYVSEGNRRVSVFTTAGAFQRAFGKGVDAGGADADVCTTACEAGSGGSAAGQLSLPWGIFVEGGFVYVTDPGNARVSTFSLAGAFQFAFGKGVGVVPLTCTASVCQAGERRSAAGALSFPNALSVSGGDVYTLDAANNRVSVFTPAGAFVRAFGKGVEQGGANADVCTTACESGSSGAAAGQLDFPQGIAVGGGEVYVTGEINRRVDVFTTAGVFLRAFGKGVEAGGANADVCTTACEIGSANGAAGELANPTAVAVSDGEVYVVERSGRRISVFTPAGVFLRAFGKGVEAGGANADVCTTACEIGSPGGAAGQLDEPVGVAVSGGEVYVTEAANRRVSVFTPAGVFVRAFGKGVEQGGADADVCTTACEAGSSGGAAGQLASPQGIAVSGGQAYVTDVANNRVGVFTTAGVFVRAFGKGVEAGASNADFCTTDCEAGSAGAGAGQLAGALGLAVSAGEIYVAELNNHRVSVFRPFVVQLSRSPATLALGARDIDDGATSSQSSTVTNTGSEPITLTGVTVGGADASQFARLTGQAGDCATGTLLAVNASCDVRVGFDPTSTGAKAATVTVASNAPDVTVALTGTGTQTELSRSAGTLAAGSRDIDDGPTAGQTSTVTNTGTESVTLTGLTLTGDASEFERLTGVAGDCAATTVLTAGQSCAVRTRFDPATVGGKSATLTVTSNAATLTVALTGSGTQTLLSRGPAALAFGARDVDGGATAGQASTVTNSGTETVTLTGLTLTGDASQFERMSGQAGDCTATTALAAGQSCDVRVRFDPTTIGAKAATITVASNAADVTVAQTGSGTQVDTDGDGVRDSLDTDDDGDGTPDTSDEFPLDPTRQTTPPPSSPPPFVPSGPTDTFVPISPDPFVPSSPAPLGAWSLQRSRSARVSGRGTALTVTTGYTAGCPAGAPACTGGATLTLRRRSARTRRSRLITLAPRASLTVPAGTQRPITFRLNRQGRSMLRELRSLTAILTVSMRTGPASPVTRTAMLRLAAPRRR